MLLHEPLMNVHEVSYFMRHNYCNFSKRGQDVEFLGLIFF